MIGVRALPIALVVALLIGLSFGARAITRAQEPTPRATPEWPRCIQGFGAQEGGRTIAVDGSVLVTLPAGSFQLVVMPPGSPDFAICHVQSSAVVTISRRTCSESSRTASTPAGNAVVDQIVASCTVPPQQPPQPHCHAGFYTTGARRFILPREEISVVLPPGDFIIIDRIRGPGSVLVCKVQSNLVSLDYSVTLSTADCSKIDAAWLDAAGEVGVNQLVSSCLVIGTPAVTTTPPTGIRPPDTGDAGLAPSAVH